MPATPSPQVANCVGENVKLADYLNEEEIRAVKATSDLKAFFLLGRTWLVIAAIFTLLTYFPNVFTVIAAGFLLAGQQMALGAFLHDCAHRGMFRTRAFNDFFGHWFAGVPSLIPLPFYREYHFLHHRLTGTEHDPDVQNIANYPVSKCSMRRKLVRDYTGKSGLKALLGALLFVNTGRVGNAASMGVQKRERSRAEILRMTIKNYAAILLVHGSLFGILFALGQPWVYLAWWFAHIFFLPGILRIRQIGEHGAMTQLSGPVRLTTRTTLANWWQRWLIAPNYINYHCEHHFAPTVPPYNLPHLNRLLQQRGFYHDHPNALVSQGYLEVLRLASADRPATAL